MIKVRFYIAGLLLLLHYQGTHAAAFWKKKPKVELDASAFVHSACEGPHVLKHSMTTKYIACAFVRAADEKSTQEELEKQAELILTAISEREQPKVLGFIGGDLSPQTNIPKECQKVRYTAAFKVTRTYMIAELSCSTFDTRESDVYRCVPFKLAYKIVRKKPKEPAIYDCSIYCDKTKAILFSLGDMLEISERIMHSPTDVSEMPEQAIFKSVRNPTVLLNLAKLMRTHFS